MRMDLSFFLKGLRGKIFTPQVLVFLMPGSLLFSAGETQGLKGKP